MLRFIVLFFIFTHTLYGLSDSETLKRANTLVKHSNKSDQFRAYNDYKNLYLKAIISEDTKLKVSSLKGIVKSGASLHIDISHYKKELKKANSHKIDKTLVKKITKKNHKIKLKSLHKLKSAKIVDNQIILKFDSGLNSKEIKYFTMYSSKYKRHKYVFDVHNAMLTKSHHLRKNGIHKIRIAQFNSNTIRIVVDMSKKTKLKYKKNDKQLTIDLSLKSSKTKIDKKNLKTPFRIDRNKIIVIDAGHGGKDPGAIGYKRYREKVVVLQIAKNVRNILKSRGYKVYMTRDKDKFVKLSNRTLYANKKNADIFVSIHANAVGRKIAKKVSGIECYFLSPSRSKRAEKVAAKENSADMSLMNKYGKQSFLNVLNHHKIIASNKLAIDLQRGILGTLNKSYAHVKDAGVREGPFWVLVGAQMPAVLVEVGFITNPKEAKRLVHTDYQKKLALGLANGIERYFIKN